jgi:hypothetical protein
VNFPEFNYPDRLKTMLEDGLYLPYFYDVLDYSKISNPDLKEHIDRVGKVFYSKRKQVVNECWLIRVIKPFAGHALLCRFLLRFPVLIKKEKLNTHYLLLY